MEEEREGGGREGVVGSDGNFLKYQKKILNFKNTSKYLPKNLQKHHEKTSAVKSFYIHYYNKIFQKHPKKQLTQTES